MQHIKRWAAAKGPGVEQHIDGLLANVCFRHTGLVPADLSATAWAAKQETASLAQIHLRADRLIWDYSASVKV